MYVVDRTTGHSRTRHRQAVMIIDKDGGTAVVYVSITKSIATANASGHSEQTIYTAVWYSTRYQYNLTRNLSHYSHKFLGNVLQERIRECTTFLFRLFGLLLGCLRLDLGTAHASFRLLLRVNLGRLLVTLRASNLSNTYTGIPCDDGADTQAVLFLRRFFISKKCGSDNKRLELGWCVVPPQNAGPYKRFGEGESKKRRGTW